MARPRDLGITVIPVTARPAEIGPGGGLHAADAWTPTPEEWTPDTTPPPPEWTPDTTPPPPEDTPPEDTPDPPKKALSSTSLDAVAAAQLMQQMDEHLSK